MLRRRGVILLWNWCCIYCRTDLIMWESELKQCVYVSSDAYSYHDDADDE